MCPEDTPDEAPPIARVDRYILKVTPCQPVVDWVRGLDEQELEEGDVPFSLEEAKKYHVATYLVPFSFDPEPVIAWVSDNYDTIFETELSGFTPDESAWPQGRSPEMFEEWFDLELLDAPIDLVDGPFYLDDLSPEELKERALELPPLE